MDTIIAETFVYLMVLLAVFALGVVAGRLSKGGL